MKRKSISHFRDNLEYNILALPAILAFVIFSYLPMFGAVIAFKDYRYDLGILGSKWVGFDNFVFFFTSQDAFRVMRNTIGYGFLFIILGVVTSVVLALLLYEISSKKMLKYLQTTMILPNFLSWVVVGYITYIFLNPTMGVLNQLNHAFHWQPVQWYAKPEVWPSILSIVNVWKGVGMGSVVYYAALMGIDSQLYEAAELDGANRWKQTVHISIPSLTPIMTMMSILAVGGILNGDFGLFYQIPRDVGVLYPTTDIINTYVYRGLKLGSMGETAAIGLFQSVSGLVLVLFTNWIVKKIEPNNAIF